MRAGIFWLLVVGGNILVVCEREHLGCMRAGISWLYASGNILVVCEREHLGCMRAGISWLLVVGGNILVVGCVFTDVQFSFSF